LGKPAEEIKESNGIASCGADQEEIKEKADEGEMKSAQIGERDLLEAKEKIKTCSAEEDGDESDE
jgi:hypothetical protein